MTTTRYMLVFSVVFGIVAIGGVCSTAPAASLPEEIQAFYTAHNFITAFSTPKERLALMQRRQTPDSAAQRLQTVGEAMAAVQNSRWVTDPAIARERPGAVADVPIDLFQVLSGRGSEKTLIVRVRRHIMDSASNLTLIDRYESATDRQAIPTETQRFEMLDGKPSVMELHFWFRFNGRWVRNTSKIRLMDNRH